MSTCPAKLYSNVTPQVFELLQLKLKGFGLELTDAADSTLELDGIKVECLYNPDKETIITQVVAKPFFVSCHAVQSEFDTVFADVMGVYPKVTVANSEDIAEIKKVNEEDQHIEEVPVPTQDMANGGEAATEHIAVENHPENLPDPVVIDGKYPETFVEPTEHKEGV